VSDEQGREHLEEQYGWAMAVIRANPEMAAFIKGVTEAEDYEFWSAERFIAFVKHTDWYQERFPGKGPLRG